MNCQDNYPAKPRVLHSSSLPSLNPSVFVLYFSPSLTILSFMWGEITLHPNLHGLTGWQKVSVTSQGKYLSLGHRHLEPEWVLWVTSQCKLDLCTFIRHCSMFPEYCHVAWKRCKMYYTFYAYRSMWKNMFVFHMQELYEFCFSVNTFRGPRPHLKMFSVIPSCFL